MVIAIKPIGVNMKSRYRRLYKEPMIIDLLKNAVNIVWTPCYISIEGNEKSHELGHERDSDIGTSQIQGIKLLRGSSDSVQTKMLQHSGKRN